MTTDSSNLNLAIEAKKEKEYESFSADLKKVHDSEHTVEKFDPIYKYIDLVYVLSGRGSVLRLPVDQASVADPEDDYYRMRMGVEIARKIFAAKGIRVPIFYNGRTLHNEYLREALKRGLFDYPKEFFIIRPIFPENTIGQAKSFKDFLETQESATIAIVSSAYHLPRVSRTFGNLSPTISESSERDPKGLIKKDSTKFGVEMSKLEEANLLLFGIDRDFKRPGIEKDLRGELDAMKNYSSGASPTIARYQPLNTFLNKTDILFQFSLEAQKNRPCFLIQSTAFQNTKVKKKKSLL